MTNMFAETYEAYRTYKADHAKILDEARLGTFWVIDNEVIGWDFALGNAEVIESRYLNSPVSHDALWKEIRDTVASSITPYEFYPRGRVIYDKMMDEFIVLADAKIIGNGAARELIRQHFVLPLITKFRTDPHYQSANVSEDQEAYWDDVDQEYKIISVAKDIDDAMSAMNATKDKTIESTQSIPGCDE